MAKDIETRPISAIPSDFPIISVALELAANEGEGNSPLGCANPGWPIPKFAIGVAHAVEALSAFRVPSRVAQAIGAVRIERRRDNIARLTHTRAAATSAIEVTGLNGQPEELGKMLMDLGIDKISEF